MAVVFPGLCAPDWLRLPVVRVPVLTGVEVLGRDWRQRDRAPDPFESCFTPFALQRADGRVEPTQAWSA
jgi:hypothetical protein